MATTTNYGWPTPDDTALVKDGALAIRTLGSSIDTTTEDLNPATTEGDLQYRGATVDVNERLAIGTAGQVLQVNSGADAPEWVTPAGGGVSTWSLVSSTAMSGNSVSITGLTENHYKIIVQSANSSSTGQDIRMTFNNNTTAANYDRWQAFQSIFGTSVTFASTSFFRIGQTGTAGSGNVTNAFIDLESLQTTGKKIMRTMGGMNVTQFFTFTQGWFNPATVVSSFQIFLTGAATFNGGTIHLYEAV